MMAAIVSLIDFCDQTREGIRKEAAPKCLLSPKDGVTIALV